MFQDRKGPPDRESAQLTTSERLIWTNVVWLLRQTRYDSAAVAQAFSDAGNMLLIRGKQR